MRNDSSNINNHNNRPISADDVRFSLSRDDFHIPASDGELDTLQADEQLRQFVSPDAELPTELIAEQKAVLLRPGDIVADRFEVVKQLGFGGMGAVYQVNDRITKQARALKVMLSSLLQSPRAQQRFVDEVTILQELAHDGVVRVYDIGEDTRRGICFFTMELIEGKTLNKLLKERGGSLPIEEALNLMRQLCRALEHAHKCTIHRDLKPQNIMVRADGSIKILDFGLAKLVSPGRMTRSSMALGTAYYQAPEQSIHLRELDQRADIYSLGVILYQMVTGEIPVGRVKPPSELDPKIPVALDDVVLKCIEPTPSDRYETVTEFANALEKAWNAGNTHGDAHVTRTAAGKNHEQHRNFLATTEEVTICGGNDLPWFSVEQGLFKTDEKREEDEARRRALTRAQCRRAMRILLCMAAILSAGAVLTFLGIRYMRGNNLRNRQESQARNRIEAGALQSINLGSGAVLDLVWIPPGEFMVRPSESENNTISDEHPQYKVEIPQGFWMGKCEVTQAQWDAVMGNNLSSSKGGANPVENASWNDCQKFLKNLSQRTGNIWRLPTEAEWEYACRAVGRDKLEPSRTRSGNGAGFRVVCLPSR